MKLKSIVDQFEHEVKVVQGKATKDRVYASYRTLPDELTAKYAFATSVAKLLNVHGWSALSSISADFELYDSIGKAKPDGPAKVGDFIQIILPGPAPANWVRIIHDTLTETCAEFTVQPCADPTAGESDQIEHFFDQQARSTFRVALDGCTISAFEIGQQEAINNQQPQAGGRAFVNTLIAETGWLFYQKIQWQLLTDYLVQG